MLTILVHCTSLTKEKINDMRKQNVKVLKEDVITMIANETRIHLGPLDGNVSNFMSTFGFQ